MRGEKRFLVQRNSPLSHTRALSSHLPQDIVGERCSALSPPIHFPSLAGYRPRPSELEAGTIWLDSCTQPPPTLDLRLTGGGEAAAGL